MALLPVTAPAFCRSGWTQATGRPSTTSSSGAAWPFTSPSSLPCTATGCSTCFLTSSGLWVSPRRFRFVGESQRLPLELLRDCTCSSSWWAVRLPIAGVYSPCLCAARCRRGLGVAGCIRPRRWPRSASVPVEVKNSPARLREARAPREAKGWLAAWSAKRLLVGGRGSPTSEAAESGAAIRESGSKSPSWKCEGPFASGGLRAPSMVGH